MYGKNIRQLRTRLFIALAIAAIAAIVMAVATLADGETSVGGMIFTLLLALPILFLEFYGLLIAPRLWLDYLKPVLRELRHVLWAWRWAVFSSPYGAFSK